jgi:hypothetical protein
MASGRLGTRRRQVAMALAIALPVGLVAVTSLLPASAAPVLDTNLQNYTLFAQDSIAFKGGNNGGGIIHGNVGVNHPSGTANLCVNGPATMDPGSQVASDWVTLGSGCRFDTLFLGGANHKVGAGAPTIGTTVIRQPWTNIVPDSALANPPEPFPCTGDLRVPDGGIATVDTDRVYCNVVIGKNANILFLLYDWHNKDQGFKPRNVWVHGSLTIGDGTEISGIIPKPGSTWEAVESCEAHFYVNSVGVASSNSSVKFGRNTSVCANVSAPNGILNLGNTTTLTGHFWARVITSDWAVNVGVPPTTTTTTTSTTRVPSTTSTSTTTTTRPSTSTSTSTTSTTRSSTTSTTSTTKPTTTTSSSTTSTTFKPTTTTFEP